jgi:hypothetical protein
MLEKDTPWPDWDSIHPQPSQVEKQIRKIAHKAIYDQPWLEKHGARNLRVLLAVLRLVWQTGFETQGRQAKSHSVRTDIWSLVESAGLGRYQAVYESLRELESQGWLIFQAGESRVYTSATTWTEGKPSVITLMPTIWAEELDSFETLPDPRLSLYDYGQAGSAGYQIICVVEEDTPYSMADIKELMGLSNGTLYRTMKKLKAHWVKVGNSYAFTNLESACVAGLYDTARADALKTKLMARRSEAEAVWAEAAEEAKQEFLISTDQAHHDDLAIKEAVEIAEAVKTEVLKEAQSVVSLMTVPSPVTPLSPVEELIRQTEQGPQ